MRTTTLAILLFGAILNLAGCAGNNWAVTAIDTGLRAEVNTVQSGSFGMDGLTISRQAGYGAEGSVNLHWEGKR